MVIQKRLEMLALHVHCMHITNGALDLAVMLLEVLDRVSAWIHQLGSYPDEEIVPVYRENLNKCSWLEFIKTFLSSKKGRSGLPMVHLTRENRVPQEDDPGVGLSSFNEDLASRGWIDAAGGNRSRYCDADNRMFYQLPQARCIGTSAENIK